MRRKLSELRRSYSLGPDISRAAAQSNTRSRATISLKSSSWYANYARAIDLGEGEKLPRRSLRAANHRWARPRRADDPGSCEG